MIQVERVFKSLGHRPVLRGASLRIVEGERVVLLGANGSGKSTLLSLIAGVLAPDHGKVTTTAKVGFAPEKPDLPEHLRVGEWLDVVASLKGDATEGADFGLAPLLGKKTTALSLGQRQRVSLAAAWLGRPDVLLLDEPTNGLDAATRDLVLDLLGTGTAVVATHDRDLAERIATRMLVVSDGQISRPM